MTDHTDGSGPRLAVSCSTPGGQARVRRAAERVLARMPRDMAEELARRCVLFCVDHRSHSAFAQGLRESATSQLASERVRQGRPAGNLVVIVLALNPWTPVEHVVAHELGHVALGHCDEGGPATLSADDLAAREVAAEDFALRWSADA